MRPISAKAKATIPSTSISKKTTLRDYLIILGFGSLVALALFIQVKHQDHSTIYKPITCEIQAAVMSH